MDNLSKLKDIKPIVELNDYSLFLFIGVILLCLVVMISLGYFLFKKFQKPKYNFDLTNSKQTAYQLIKIIREKEGSEKYIEKLHNYSYKKEVPKIDETLFEEIIKKFKIKRA